MTSTVEADRAAEPVTTAGAEERLVIPSSALTGDATPSRILIAPWGEVTSANGTFVMDEESAQLVVEAFRGHGTDLPIDYEHQSLGGVYASPTGQAPAAGWIRSLAAVPPEQADGDGPGLFADVAWTESAQAKLTAKEYRFLSPVVIVRKRDRRVVALHSAALTNKPAISGMKPIVNRVVEGEEAGPGEASFPQSDGSERADQGEEGAVSCADEAVEMLRLRLGLEASDDVEAVLIAAEDRLSSRLREAERREADERVESAMRAGKLTSAQREWAMSLALKDAELFEDWVASAPVIVAPGRTEAPERGGTGAVGRDRAVVIASARSAFHSEPALAMLTSESAWVRSALREAGLEME